MDCGERGEGLAEAALVVNIFDFDAEPAFRLRGRQPEWFEQIKTDLQTRTRLLCVAPGGVGKTALIGALCKWMWEQGKRTLVLENRDRLTEQTAKRIRNEFALEVDVEKGDQHASPFAPAVVMCVQSGSKISRLTGFAPDHFALVIPDEIHLALNPSWLRIIYYFHYGAESLADGWVKPKDGMYGPKASVVGFTASPNLGQKRNLGEICQGPKPSINYSFLDAIEEGWLVGLREINIPVQIDARAFRVKRTAEGNAFSVADQNNAYTPELIQKLAEQYVEHASDRKGMIFVPSVKIASQLSAVIGSMGLRSTFVSGECIDKNEKTDKFAADGPGSVLINCCLYTFGVDFPDVDTIAPFGAIISKVKYIQSVYRGTRVLEGVLKDGMTVEERIAAIAASTKPYTLILSPFFISDRIDICEIFDMYCEEDGVKKRMKAAGGNPQDTARKAERDYLKHLEKEAKKHADRTARVIDPVKWSVMLGDAKLAAYTPTEPWQSNPIRPEQVKLLISLNMDPVKYGIHTAGQAQQFIGILLLRKDLGRASPGQLEFLRQLRKKDEATGQLVPMFTEESIATMKAGKAGAIIGSTTAKWRASP